MSRKLASSTSDPTKEESMTDTKTWTQTLADIAAAGANLTSDQLEAIRRVGAKRRHEARTLEAYGKIRILVGQLMVHPTPAGRWDLNRLAVWYYLEPAITRALACVGLPGSRAGTSPPGMFQGHPNQNATLAAWDAALLQVHEAFVRDATRESAPMVTGEGDHTVKVRSGDTEDTYKLTVVHGLVSISRNDRDVGPEDWDAIALWRSDDHPEVTEHVLDWVIAVMAESVDWWAQRGCEGPMPAPPPADLCKEHARLVARRRGISVAHNEHV